jgi:hypothetical protein
LDLLLNPNGVPEIPLIFLGKKKKKKKKKMLRSRCWSEFNRICKNTHARIFEIFYKFFLKKIINTGVFWEYLQDLTANPNGILLSETFGNFDISVWNICLFSSLISKRRIIWYLFVKLFLLFIWDSLFRKLSFELKFLL